MTTIRTFASGSLVAQIVAANSHSAGLATTMTKRIAQAEIDHVISAIKDELAEKGEVRIKGFGTIKVSKRAARSGRNPLTGETIAIPAAEGIKVKKASDY